MNCEAGDLAIVVRSGKDGMDMRGRIVTCLKVISTVDEPHWLVTPEIWCQGFLILFPDSSLRPIRDPGDDAIDEMLRPLPEVVGETGAVW